MEKNEFRKLLAKVVLVTGIVTFLVMYALIPPAYANGGVCAETDTSVKYEAVDEELNGVVLEAGTEFCVKGGTDNSGALVADGVTTLHEYIAQSGITVGNGNVPGVSHYVIYDEPEPPVDPPTEPPPSDPPSEPPVDDPEPESPKDPEPEDTPEELPNTGLGSTLALLAAGLGSIGAGLRLRKVK